MGALREAAKQLKGPWERYQKWIDTELGRLWKMRGPCPGLGAALAAFGIELGVFAAYELGKHIGENEVPWPAVDQMFQSPKKYLSADATRQIGAEQQTLWKSLPKNRRALLALISRFEITPEQAATICVVEERDNAGISVSDEEIPYRLYEVTQRTATPISFSTVDLVVFPDASVRDKHPPPKLSRVDIGTEPRRIHSLVIQTLEAAAVDGDTLLPRDDVITTIRELELRPGCPITGDLMTVAEAQFHLEVQGVVMAYDKPAFQLNRLTEVGSLIKLAIEKRIAGKNSLGSGRLDCPTSDQERAGATTGRGHPRRTRSGREGRGTCQTCGSKVLRAHRSGGYCYFHVTGDDKGVGDAAEAWQVITPVRGMPYGLVGLNRYIHKAFRAHPPGR